MKLCRKLCETGKGAAVAAAALSAVLALGIFCRPALAGTGESGTGQMITQEEIIAAYNHDVQSSLYRAPERTSIEVMWYKVGESNPSFNEVDLDTGEQILILPAGYEMSFWFEIDNGGADVIRTPEQVITPLYAARRNEGSTGPGDAYLYEKITSAAEASVCSDLPQDFDYRSLGRGIAAVERVVRIRETGSGAAQDSRGEAIYLDIPAKGAPSIFHLEITDREMYRIAPGDTLQSIAGDRYCDPAMWPAIFRRNRNVISHGDLIYAGQMIVIPKTEAEIAGDVIVMPPRREIPQGDEALLYSDICEMADLGGVYQLSDGTRASVEWKDVYGDGVSAVSGQKVLFLAEGHEMTVWFTVRRGASEAMTDVMTVAPFYIGQRNENLTSPRDEYLYHKNKVPEASTIVPDRPSDYDPADQECTMTRTIRIVNLATGAYYEEEIPVY